MGVSSEIDRLHDIAREQRFHDPIHDDAQLPFSTGKFGEVNRAPHQPCKETREAYFVLEERNRQLSASCMISDRAERSERIEVKGSEGTPFHHCLYISCDGLRLPDGKLRSWRASLA